MTEIRHSVCALDCPDACSVLVSVDEGMATKLRGNPDHPVTRGFLCAKVARYLERQYSPARLMYPMRRCGAKGEGQFARVTWDEALDEIAERLAGVAKEFGPEAILPYSYAGTMGLLNGSGMDRRFFHRLGASRLERTICSAAGGAGLMDAVGFRYGTEPEQFAQSKLIIAWGANIMGTNVHLWPFITEARRAGAKFYTIDPRKNKTGRLADRHYFIHPGSDTALAFGLGHVIVAEGLFDRDYVTNHATGFDDYRARVAEYPPERVEALTGIPREDVAALAREYAGTRPAAIRLNYGVQRSERGGLAVHAITCLPALVGSWKEVGGGLQLSTSQAFQFDRAALERADLQPNGTARLINMSMLGQALTELHDPPVRAMVVYNSNPAAVAPNENAVRRGLANPDLFTVVIEQMQTDTADWADFVLPATTFLEHTDLYLAYGHYHLQIARPVVDAPGECRSNVEIFRALAKRMGFADACFDDSDDQMMAALLASGHEFLKDISVERLDREHSVRLNVSKAGEPFLPFARGTANLAMPDYVPPVESRLGDGALKARFPLELISPKNDDSMNSTFGNRDAADAQTAVAEINTTDAAPRGIADGDAVRIFNDRGSVLLTARVNGAVTPGVVAVPAVRWPKRSPNRAGINSLTAERLTDRGNGPVFYSCLVEIEKSGD